MAHAAPLICRHRYKNAIRKWICMRTHKITFAHTLCTDELCVQCGTCIATCTLLHTATRACECAVQLCLHNPHTYTQMHTFIFPASLQIDFSIWCSVKCELKQALTVLTALGQTHTFDWVWNKSWVLLRDILYGFCSNWPHQWTTWTCETEAQMHCRPRESARDWQLHLHNSLECFNSDLPFKETKAKINPSVRVKLTPTLIWSTFLLLSKFVLFKFLSKALSVCD